MVFALFNLRNLWDSTNQVMTDKHFHAPRGFYTIINEFQKIGRAKKTAKNIMNPLFSDFIFVWCVWCERLVSKLLFVERFLLFGRQGLLNPHAI